MRLLSGDPSGDPSNRRRESECELLVEEPLSPHYEAPKYPEDFLSDQAGECLGGKRSEVQSYSQNLA